MKIITYVLAAMCALLLTACGGSNTLSPDFDAILDRTEQAMVEIEGTEYPDETAMMTAFNIALYQRLNAAPAVYDTPIGLRLNEDGSIFGFTDANADNVQSGGDKALFKIEIDAENSRLILKDETGQYHGRRSSSSGLMTGLFWGSMLNRQRSAGLSSSRFNNANVKTTTPGRKAAPSSRARTGGVRSGK